MYTKAIVIYNQALKRSPFGNFIENELKVEIKKPPMAVLNIMPRV